MKKSITLLVIFLGLGLVIGGLVLVKAQQFKAMAESGKNQPIQTVAINTHVVGLQQWERSLSAVGSVRAVQGVTVTTEVSGQIQRIAFESGDPVEAGEVLVELDASIEKARLESAKAALELAEISLNRTRGLRAKNTVPQSDLDEADALAKQARAAVTNVEAQLAQKVIRAPFSGRLGIRQVDLGQYLNPGDPIVSLQNHDVIYVDFSLPQEELAEIERGMPVRISAERILEDPLGGTLTSVDTEVARGTRAVRLRATFKNDRKQLVTGMFVDASVVLPAGPQVLAVPQTAVKYAPFGNSVFVLTKAPAPTAEELATAEKSGAPVTPEGHPIVEQKFVRLGRTQGDFIEVLEGLEEGDEIAATGVFQLANDSAVVINNDVELDYKQEPLPDNA